MACTQNPIEEQSAIRIDAPETIKVGFEDSETRIQLNSAQKTVWTKNDLVSVFYKSNANQKWEYRGETGERVAELYRVDAGTASSAMNYVVLAYPYSTDYVISTATGNIETTLPAIQHYAAGSYGVGENLMVSRSEFTQFSLKSVCGWLKLQLTGNGEVVKSIRFRGNNDEQVAGLIYVDTETAEATLAAEMGGSDDNNAGGNLIFDDTILTEVTLDCGAGVTLGAESTSFYISLPPQTFANGFTVEIESDGYKPMILSTENELVIERNTIQPMASVEHNASPAFPVTPQIPNNEIWYTSSDGSIVDPYAADAFGVFIISNIYENGKGIIRCFGDITNIGCSAFLGCERLTSIIIPDSVGYIGVEAFAGCTSLLSIDMPDGLGYIGEAAFIGCASLLSIDMPDGLGDIGDAAFQGCSSLLSIDIPNDVSYIGWRAFADCTSLTSILLGNGVKIIELEAFHNCKSLKRVDITDLEAWCKIDFKYSYYNDWYSSNPLCYAENLYLNGVLVENLVIPESITDVRPLAFHGANCIKSAVIHDGVSYIGIGAFALCGSMKSVTIGNSVKRIELAAFALSGLESVTIPNSVVGIDDHAFFGCGGIGEITIGNNISYIGYNAFDYCNALTRVNISNLDAWCRINFSGSGSNPLCYANNLYLDGVLLEHLIIPESIADVGPYVFCGANCLKSVVIHSGVTSIYGGAFMDCYSLKWVYCMATTPPYEDYAFYDNHDERKIYVPMESVEAYKSADGWSSYADAIVGYNF